MPQVLSNEEYNQIVGQFDSPAPRVLSPEEYSSILENSSIPADDDIFIYGLPQNDSLQQP